jgi:gentisate 1,2-dioxygenase
VLDGEGAYTAVDGERTTMRRGDFIITPAWTFHDHGNLGDQPVVWLDGLDIPTVRFLDAGFAEKAASQVQSVARPEGDALARYGANLLPLDYAPKPADPTKVFVYPHEKTRAAMQAIAAASAPDPHLAHKQRYVNPATGTSPMPTIAAFTQAIPAGFETRALRSTDGTIHVCLEGSGEAEIAGTTYRFAENDVFVVPSWHRLQLRASATRCCSAFPTAPCSRRWACGAKSGFDPSARLNP